MNMMVSFIIGFIGIGIMVSIHELGHFLVAKAVSITVEVFAFGWGKTLVRWRRGETEFRLNMLPMGGYCRLKGSGDLKRAIDNHLDSFSFIEEGSIFAAHPFKRICTYIAGPIANILFALIVFVPFFLLGYMAPSDPNRVVVTSDYPTLFSLSSDDIVPAKAGGLLTGDTILSVDGIKTPDFQTMQEVLASRSPKTAAVFKVSRNQQELEFQATPVKEETTGRILFGLTSYVDPIVATVEPLAPETIAGLSAGDRIVSIQGLPVNNSLDISLGIENNPLEIELELIRAAGERRTITFSPYKNMDGTAQLQFTLQRSVSYHEGKTFPAALKESGKQVFATIGSTFALIPSLFTGMLRPEEVLSGPLRLSYLIGDMTNSSLQTGILNGIRMVFYLLGMVSVSLAVANLLPIPALDGGLVLLSTLELIRGRLLSPKTYLRIQTIGVYVIIVLMILAVIGDFRYFF